MFSKLILIIVFYKIEILKSTKPDLPLIEIENGEWTITRILGTKEQDWLGGEYFAFRGMPYAKPPIDELRFKDPQVLENLPSYIDARYDGHDCPSIYATNASENCLIINVYTKALNPIKPLPVLVFIHPGGLYLGSSLSSFIGAQYLLSKPLVLVTFNYRLATLGFLNLGTKDVPGNAGFKDQVHALQWLHKYIANFGGAANDVTLMGYSAGGLSVSLYLAAKMSRGLFQKAIVMSGILPPQTILPQSAQIQLAMRQALKLNCSINFDKHKHNQMSNVTAQVIHCLNEFNGNEIAATLRTLFHFGKDHPLYLWRPVVEHDFGQMKFLEEDFYALIEKGDFARVPLLIGFTDGEFCTAAAEILNDETLSSRIHKEFEALAPFIFMYENHENESFISQAILRHYKGLEEKQERKFWNFDGLCNAISDALIRFGSYRLSQLAAKYVDVYNYKFVYRGAHTNLQFSTENPRVEHLDDLMYLFQMPAHRITKTNNKTNAHDGDGDAKIVELYTNFIWDFITNGKISINSSKFPQSYTLINATLLTRNGINFDEAQFWQELFP